jgi:hypothetical protein
MYQGVISLHASYLINKRLIHFVTMKQNPIVICSNIVWSHGNYGVDLWIGLGSKGACQIQLIMSCCNGIIWWQGFFSDEQFYRCIMEFFGWSGWLEITLCFKTRIRNGMMIFTYTSEIGSLVKVYKQEIFFIHVWIYTGALEVSYNGQSRFLRVSLFQFFSLV